MVKKKVNVQETDTEDRPIAIEMTERETDLRSNLAEIKKRAGVVGYILKDTNSAVIDLNEPARISEYAIFSSTTNETACKLADIFDLGEVRRVMVEGRQMKMLSVDIGESEVSVFMEKNADIDSICGKLRTLV